MNVSSHVSQALVFGADSAIVVRAKVNDFRSASIPIKVKNKELFPFYFGFLQVGKDLLKS
jgi:hypothetical protein